MILGFHSSPQNTLNKIQIHRLETALKASKKGKVKIFFISGGSPRNEVSEALVMSGYLLDQKIPASSIILETNSNTTLENLMHSFEMIPKDENVFIVSHALHLYRTHQYIKKLFPNDLGRISYLPYYVPFKNYFYNWAWLLYEILVWYKEKKNPLQI